MKHTLVIGGTGMLLAATTELASKSEVLTSVARNPLGLDKFRAQPSNQIHQLAIDYRESNNLLAQISKSIDQYGPIDLALFWIHSTAPDAPFLVSKLISRSGSPCDLFHVLGSSHADPERDSQAHRERFEQLPNCSYHEIILGFIKEESHSRWLADSEISMGTLQAIEERCKRFVVGEVKPWSDRP